MAKQATKKELGLLESALQAVAELVGASEESVVSECRKFGMKVNNLEDIYNQPTSTCKLVAEDYNTWAKLQAGSTGFGFGMGGFATMIPDIASLAAINIRQIQCIGMSYGFRYVTNGEKAELWRVYEICLGAEEVAKNAGKVAMKQLAKKIMTTSYAKMPVIHTIKKIAQYFGVTLFKRHFVKAIPFIGGIFGGGLNYWMTDTIGVKAIEYFEAKRELFAEKGLNPHESAD